MGDTEQAAKEIETEMYGEMASSLGRAGDKVDYLLFRMELMEQSGGGADEFNALRREALVARQELVIQQIACGFRFGAEEKAAARYPIPPAKGDTSPASL